MKSCVIVRYVELFCDDSEKQTMYSTEKYAYSSWRMNGVDKFTNTSWPDMLSAYPLFIIAAIVRDYILLFIILTSCNIEPCK